MLTDVVNGMFLNQVVEALLAKSLNLLEKFSYFTIDPVSPYSSLVWNTFFHIWSLSWTFLLNFLELGLNSSHEWVLSKQLNYWKSNLRLVFHAGELVLFYLNSFQWRYHWGYQNSIPLGLNTESLAGRC